MIIGLTGLAACGKSAISRHLKKRYGYKTIAFSDILIKEAEKRGLLKRSMSLEEKKAILSTFGDTWRKQTKKNEIIAIKIKEFIKK